jgi:hypothetical protein
MYNIIREVELLTGRNLSCFEVNKVKGFIGKGWRNPYDIEFLVFGSDDRES